MERLVIQMRKFLSSLYEAEIPARKYIKSSSQHMNDEVSPSFTLDSTYPG